MGCLGRTLTLWWQPCPLWTTLLGGSHRVKDPASLLSFSLNSCLGLPLAKPNKEVKANGRHRSTSQEWGPHAERRREAGPAQHTYRASLPYKHAAIDLGWLRAHLLVFRILVKVFRLQNLILSKNALLWHVFWVRVGLGPPLSYTVLNCFTKLWIEIKAV